jgi:hypothetical protein
VGRNESIAQTFRSGKTWISCLLGWVGGVEMVAKSLLCSVMVTLVYASIGFATDGAKPILTISVRKPVHQMAERVVVKVRFDNPTKEKLMGSYLEECALDIVKTKSHGPPFLSEIEPGITKWWTPAHFDSMVVNERHSTKYPPNYSDSILTYYDLLNPGVYSLQGFLRGGVDNRNDSWFSEFSKEYPPPKGGWYSSVVEFEVLEPKGAEREAWRLLGKIYNKIEPLKVNERAVPSNAYEKGKPYRDSMEQIKEEAYTQVIKRYPHTACAQYAVPHLWEIYYQKVEDYVAQDHFDSARDLAKHFIPDSLSKSFLVYINEKEKVTIQSKEEFRIKILKEQEENLRKKLKTK